LVCFLSEHCKQLSIDFVNCSDLHCCEKPLYNTVLNSEDFEGLLSGKKISVRYINGLIDFALLIGTGFIAQYVLINIYCECPFGYE
jgi:hypothetical protein